MTEILFTEALEAAQAIDAEYEASGIPRGSLHGLPVSLKDCFRIKGTDATIGYTAFVDKPTLEGEESEITKIMRESGAILFCKTNVPLALMAGEVRTLDLNYFHETDEAYRHTMPSTVTLLIRAIEVFLVVAHPAVKVHYWLYAELLLALVLMLEALSVS